ncbi:MAG TPA: rod shape-determining protein MreD [Candidatus Cloacimonadota bacterium]|nr:rod shape-determining protein MreD [Candidatus Cloacimonadota bacterium]
MYLKGFLSFLLGLLFFYLQVLIMPALAIGRIVPNILIPWMIFTLWTKPQNIALSVGFIIALLYDTLYPATFGLNALLFTIMGVAVNLFRMPFEQDSVVAKLLTIAVANLIFSLLTLMGFGLLWRFTAELMLVSLGAFVYNLIFSLIVFWAMQLISRLRIVIANV